MTALEALLWAATLLVLVMVFGIIVDCIYLWRNR